MRGPKIDDEVFKGGITTTVTMTFGWYFSSKMVWGFGFLQQYLAYRISDKQVLIQFRSKLDRNGYDQDWHYEPEHLKKDTKLFVYQNRNPQ